MRGLFDVNDGSRPSRLELDRALTGECELAGQDELLERHRAEVQATPLPAFDLEAIQQRAGRQAEVVPLFGWNRAVPILLAALALLVVLVPRGPDHRTKGGTGLEVYVQRGAEVLRVQPGETLVQGDRVRFATRADGHETVVVLSVDGDGKISLFYPEDPDEEPVPVDPYQRGLLDEAIQLDGAVGPESFVAVFSPGATASALELVRDTYAAGGHDALAELSRSDPGVAVLTVEKAP